MRNDIELNRFIEYLSLWHSIKKEFDFKNPTKFKKPIQLFKHNLKKELDNPRFLKIAKSWYRDNPVDFIEHWIVTYDPKRGLGIIPFILFPKQEEFIAWVTERLEKKESGLVEKTREVGLSWLAIAWSVWRGIFETIQK